MIKIFSTKGMYEKPSFGEYFRIGYNLGACIFTCKYFVIMKIERD